MQNLGLVAKRLQHGIEDTGAHNSPAYHRTSHLQSASSLLADLSDTVKLDGTFSQQRKCGLAQAVMRTKIRHCHRPKPDHLPSAISV